MIESVRRVLGLQLFDTQLHAGIIVSRGAVAEMQTGEGKTLSVALPAYFRSLLGLYNTDETGRQVGKSNYLLQWQDNQRRLVAPANLAERDFIYPMP